MKRRRSRGRRAPWVRSAATLVAVALAAAALTAGVLATTSSAADPPPQAVHTTSGPVPPSSVRPATGALRAVATAAGEHVVTGVPAYIWRDGCGPTSVGMIVGYYDGRGFPDLIPGEAADQAANPSVSQSIASHSGAGEARHYEDYSLPKDSGGALLPDRSEAPAGDEHASDSVADFMHTSWSAEGLAYGWSWSSRAGPSFVDYVQRRLTGVAVSYRSYYYGEHGASSLTFAVLQQEVDAGRPLVFIVDCDGNGTTDHAVAAIGYRETGGYPEYACWDTWYPAIRWQRFLAMSDTYAWGVWGATAFTLTTDTDPSPSPLPSTVPSASPSPTASPAPGDDTSPPVTTVTGVDAAWHRAPVVLTFAAADDVAGVAFTETDTDWAGWAAFPALPGTLRVAGKGVHRVRYRTTDRAGNVEVARTCAVRIDTEGPKTKARAASVRKGARATFRYRIDDLTPKASVRIVVKTLAGVPRKTLKAGLRGTNATRAYRWRCSLPRGVYRYVVYATDQAGNRQVRAGSARLTVH